MISEITRESGMLGFGVLHLGDHNLNCGVREYEGKEAYQTLVQEVSEAFGKADFPETILLLDKHFGASIYSLTSLFRDEQRKILDLILGATLQEVETIYRQLYEHHVPLMRFLKGSGVSPPKPLYVAAELVLNASLRGAFEDEELDPELITTFLEEAEVEGIFLDADTLEYALRKSLERLADRLLANPSELHLLQRLVAGIGLLGSLPFQVNLWKVQNISYDLYQKVYPELRKRAEKGDETAGEWIGIFKRLGEKLSIRIE